MKNAWVSKIMIITLVGGLCLVGYGLAHAVKPIKPRFSVLNNDPTWVLDKTTALQWQLTPGLGGGDHPSASAYCANLGGGSRLPEVKELISLVDYSMRNPALPDGHPFQSVQGVYWTATSVVGGKSPNWWIVDLDSGSVNSGNPDAKIPAWCVR